MPMESLEETDLVKGEIVALTDDRIDVAIAPDELDKVAGWSSARCVGK